MGERISKPIAARARRLNISSRQLDYWHRNGLIDVDRVEGRPIGTGNRRAWHEVTDRRLAACSLVMTAATNETPLSVKRRLVDVLDRCGWVVIPLKAGEIRLTLDPEVAAA